MEKCLRWRAIPELGVAGRGLPIRASFGVVAVVLPETIIQSASRKGKGKGSVKARPLRLPQVAVSKGRQKTIDSILASTPAL
jgi:hypothetical protein